MEMTNKLLDANFR